MTATSPRVNPLFSSSTSDRPATPSPSRMACQRATKLGGYGGMAVAAWLVTPRSRSVTECPQRIVQFSGRYVEHHLQR